MNLQLFVTLMAESPGYKLWNNVVLNNMFWINQDTKDWFTNHSDTKKILRPQVV
jgi:hypothetical protein